MSVPITMFVVTNDHLRLLKRMCVGWQYCEFGAPEINPKRPYGNSDVVSDIGEILEIPHDRVEYGESYYSESVSATLESLHEEMETVLQILVVNLGIQVGTYVRKDKYSTKWEFNN